MSRDAAATYSSGSGGAIWELRSVARYLFLMLRGGPVFSHRAGAIESVHVQARLDNWDFDDVVLQCTDGHVSWRALISCKSGPLTASATWGDTLHDAWSHLLGKNGFVLDCDVLVVEASSASSKEVAILRQLATQALVTDALTFHRRITSDAADLARAFSRDLRDRYAACSCPPDLRGETPEPPPAFFLRNCAFFTRDWLTTPSESEGHLLEEVSRLLIDATPEKAKSLWETLFFIASELSPHGGRIARSDLVARVRQSGFDLRAFLDTRDDLQRIQTWTTQRASSLVAHSLSGFHLARDQVIAQVQEQLAGPDAIFLVGPSGAGKSSLAVRVLEQLSGCQPAFVPAESLLDTSWQLLKGTLRHSWDDVFAHGGIPFVWVLDGAEKLLSADRQAEFMLFVSQSLGTGKIGRNRLIVTVQAHAVDELLGLLGKLQVSATCISVAGFDDEEIEQVAAHVPTLRFVLSQDAIQEVLRLPKVLDVIVAHHQKIADTVTFRDESDVALWYWNHILKQALSSPVQRALQQLAADQAATWTSQTPLADLSPEMAEGLDRTQQAGVCSVLPWDRIAFTHDIIAEWVQASLLMSRGEAWARTVVGNVRWHGGLRLWLQQHLPRAGEAGIWTACWMTPGLLGNLALDALITSSRAPAIIDALWPQLIAEDGARLRSLIARLLMTGTKPHPQLSTPGEAPEDIRKRHIHRTPLADPWIVFSSVLQRHFQEFTTLAPVESAKLVELWILWGPHHPRTRVVYATLGIKLGMLAWESHHIPHAGSLPIGLRWDNETRQSCYEASLVGSVVFGPGTHQFFRLFAARRLPEDIPTITPIPHGYVQPGAMARGRGVSGRPEKARMPEPWAHGPLFRVDAAFRHVCLEHGALRLMLWIADPALVRELLLAMFIAERHPGDTQRDEMPIDRHSYGLSRGDAAMEWHHPNWSPWPRFFQRDRTIALETITTLVNHSTGCVLQALYADHGSTVLKLLCADGEREYPGTIEFLDWGKVYASHPAIHSALMAIEQLLMDLADAGRMDDCQSIIDKLLMAGNSCAFFVPLWNFAKFKSELIFTSLAPLMSSIELVSWDHRHGQDLGDMMPLFSLTAQRFDELKAWRTRAHCTVQLGDLAPQYFLFNPAVGADLAERLIEWWTQILPTMLDPEYATLCRRQIEYFTRGNWSELDIGDRTGFRFNPPAWLVETDRLHAEPARNFIRAYSLTTRAWKALRGESPGGFADGWMADFLWLLSMEAEFTAQLALNPDRLDFDLCFRQPLAASLAVLENVYPEWMQAHGEQAVSAREAVLGMVLKTRLHDPEYVHDRGDLALEPLLTEIASQWMVGLSGKWADAGRELCILLCNSRREATAGAFFRAILRKKPVSTDLVCYLLGALVITAEASYARQTLTRFFSWEGKEVEAKAIPQHVETLMESCLQRWKAVLDTWGTGQIFQEDRSPLAGWLDRALTQGRLMAYSDHPLKPGTEREIFSLRPALDDHFLITETIPHLVEFIRMHRHPVLVGYLHSCLALVFAEYQPIDHAKAPVSLPVASFHSHKTYLEYPYQGLVIDAAIQLFINEADDRPWQAAWSRIWSGGNAFVQLYAHWTRAVVDILAKASPSALVVDRWRAMLQDIFSPEGWIHRNRSKRFEYYGMALGIESFGSKWSDSPALPVLQTAEFHIFFLASLNYEGDVRESGRLARQPGFESLGSVFILAMAEQREQLKITVDEAETIDLICEVFLHACLLYTSDAADE